MRKAAWIILLGVIGLLIVESATATALASEPSIFAVLTDVDKESPTAGLNGTVTVRIDGDSAVDTKQVQLRVDGSLLSVEPRWDPRTRDLAFALARNDKNAALWSRLLGAPFSHQETDVPITVEISGHPLKFGMIPDLAKQSKEASFTLKSYDTSFMIFGIFVLLVVVIATAVACRWTTMIRDSIVPQVRRDDRPFSLGRFQMAFWFCLIFASFLFILLVTGDLNSITSESFVLLGISGATALGAVAVDQSKSDPVIKTEQALVAMGLKTIVDVQTVYDSVFIQNKGSYSASSVIPGATVAGIANPTLQQLWDAYQRQIESIKTDGFWKDLVNDVNGPTIHRWQVLIWTLALGVIYVWRVYANLEVPTLGTNLLTLMGISGGVYLGFKIPERQS